MKQNYKKIRQTSISFLSLMIILLGLGPIAFAQVEIVFQDNFDTFIPGDNEKYKCSSYWTKYDEKGDGNNVAFLDMFYSGDEFGMKANLEAGVKYKFAFKFKRKYGNNMNLICTWNEATSAGIGDVTRRVYDAPIENSETSEAYYSIETSTFTVENEGLYVLYIGVSDGDYGVPIFVDDFVLYKGEGNGEEECLAPIDFAADVKGTKVTLSWKRTTETTPLIYEEFEGDFPPADWSTIVTNDYDQTTSWHKFDKIIGNDPIPYEGNSCALVVWDVDPQDEWLITPIAPNAVYIDFWFWMSSYILELRNQEGFVDHYYVKVSYDGGETWNVLWDAAESCLGTNDWERVCLNLGDVTANTKVAFQALSAEDDGLFLNWFIDNVKVTDANNKALSAIGIDGFSVYRNDVKIASNLHSDVFTDLNVEIGIHNYCVTAHYLGLECESEKACATATVGEVPCNIPNNLTYTVTPNNEKPGTFDIMLYWDEPDYSGRDVYYYKSYVNGAPFGLWIEPYETNIGQSQMIPGTYRYAVTAVYDQPACESEQVYVDIKVGGTDCLSPDGVKAEVDGNNVKLTWDKRDNATGYTIYRADVQIAKNIKDATYNDSNAPDGTYDYCVIAECGDVISEYELYSCATVNIGVPVIYSLPFEEDFTSYFKPKDWIVTDLTNPTRSMVWRFNNPGNREVEGSDFDRAFVILDSEYYGGGAIQKSELITPNINCSENEKIVLEFDMQYIGFGDESILLSDSYLFYSTDDGNKWTKIDKLQQEIMLLPTQEPSPAVNKSYTIIVKDSKTVSFKWEYSGSYDLFLALDNVIIKGLVGVDEINEGNVSIYPNPAKEQIVITSNVDINDIQIINAAGKTCMYIDNNDNINISALSNGVYIVRISTDNGIISRKLIIRK